ncbi:hypothetical protein HK100_009577 [Physocladia obscura]|uniref:Uncharacterized protein n=1 Tax=Physocladia obscura TaxID=109957 RepID=A0AAD5XA51_9FUNG|nr:hypothetical protein HK100_009577 [Physocladia obscura]
MSNEPVSHVNSLEFNGSVETDFFAISEADNKFDVVLDRKQVCNVIDSGYGEKSGKVIGFLFSLMRLGQGVRELASLAENANVVVIVAVADGGESLAGPLDGIVLVLGGGVLVEFSPLRESGGTNSLGLVTRKSRPCTTDTPLMKAAVSRAADSRRDTSTTSDAAWRRLGARELDHPADKYCRRDPQQPLRERRVLLLPFKPQVFFHSNPIHPI